VAQLDNGLMSEQQNVKQQLEASSVHELANVKLLVCSDALITD